MIEFFLILQISEDSLCLNTIDLLDQSKPFVCVMNHLNSAKSGYSVPKT